MPGFVFKSTTDVRTASDTNNQQVAYAVNFEELPGVVQLLVDLLKYIKTLPATACLKVPNTLFRPLQKLEDEKLEKVAIALLNCFVQIVVSGADPDVLENMGENRYLGIDHIAMKRILASMKDSTECENITSKFPLPLEDYSVKEMYAILRTLDAETSAEFDRSFWCVLITEIVFGCIFSPMKDRSEDGKLSTPTKNKAGDLYWPSECMGFLDEIIKTPYGQYACVAWIPGFLTKAGKPCGNTECTPAHVDRYIYGLVNNLTVDYDSYNQACRGKPEEYNLGSVLQRPIEKCPADMQEYLYVVYAKGKTGEGMTGEKIKITLTPFGNNSNLIIRFPRNHFKNAVSEFTTILKTSSLVEHYREHYMQDFKDSVVRRYTGTP